MPVVYIGIGSNIGPEINIPAAIRMIKARVRLIEISTFYRTSAIDCSGSPAFYNGVVCIETEISPRDLKNNVLCGIENALGRVRTSDKNAPRTIDLDIIVYGNSVISEPGITIPDPDVYIRAFVAVPLAELNSVLILPDTGRQIKDVADNMADQRMTKLGGFTASLRKELENESGQDS